MHGICRHRKLSADFLPDFELCSENKALRTREARGEWPGSEQSGDRKFLSRLEAWNDASDGDDSEENGELQGLLGAV